MVSATSLLGASGEYYVMAELLRRNLIAALAPQGVPNMDIVITDIQGETLSALQVKTRRAVGSDGGWHMRPKHEIISSKRLFYCFVDLGNELSDVPIYYIIPSSVVATVIHESHLAWLSHPGHKGQKRNDSSVRRLLPDYSKAYKPDPCPYPSGWLDKYKDAWYLLDHTP